jgi:DNA polymerase-1
MPNDLAVLDRFEEIWLHDFEFIARPGERPDVVCLAAHELRSGRTIRLWRDALDECPPYRTDDKVLFINFVANAEMCCHLALGWPLPKHVLDLSPPYLNLVNGCSTPEGKGLIGLLRRYGLDAIDTQHKKAMQARVMQGGPFTMSEREQILAYCAGDVDMLVRVLPCILPQIDLDIALYHGEFVAVSAQMEHHGVPIDTVISSQLAEPRIWREIRDEMVPAIDAQYSVYVRDAAGDWTFNMERFGAYLKREGIEWPLTGKGRLDTKRKTFEDMSKGYPQLENLRQLRHARDKMRKFKLVVGADGRNRTVLWPFKAKTGRTQPNASKWIFSPAVWLRSLVKPGPGMAVAYIDYSSMEFLLAASLSDGHCGATNTMLDMYRSGDPYLAFTKTIGAVPTTATRKTHEELRDKYKTMMLSVQYGIGTSTLATRLQAPHHEAHEMLAQHRSLFGQYWSWSDDYIQHALQTGVVRTAFGWTYRIGVVGDINDRSLRNWPIQSAGADILRIACILGARRGIRLLAPVHDAVLIEAPIDRIEADVALMQECMRRASRIVLNATADGTHELRTDVKVVRYPDRYSDKRGAAMWARVIGLLETQALQRRSA